jgi:hypothetical protein
MLILVKSGFSHRTCKFFSIPLIDSSAWTDVAVLITTAMRASLFDHLAIIVIESYSGIIQVLFCSCLLG